MHMISGSRAPSDSFTWTLTQWTSGRLARIPSLTRKDGGSKASGGGNRAPPEPIGAGLSREIHGPCGPAMPGLEAPRVPGVPLDQKGLVFPSQRRRILKKHEKAADPEWFPSSDGFSPGVLIHQPNQ